jgi:hypothetical protein
MTLPFSTERPDIDAEFAIFHEENPRVWEWYIRVANRFWNEGQRKGSSEQIIQVIRWEIRLETTGVDFKIKNEFRRRYALLLEATDPKFKGFFRKRRAA